ncbi:MAG: hypothetical protein M1530_03735 [Candidatus Marsarchaeota archaeon]|nr:hypothetical protein [Candidatus Marsarchaeota archaeon]
MNQAIEQAFETASKVILGRPLSGLTNYEAWLQTRLRPVRRHKSAVSAQLVYDPPLVFYAPASRRAVKQAEALELGRRQLEREEASALTLDNAAQKLEPLRYHSSDAITGTNTEMEECSLYIDSSYCFRTYSTVNSKFCAYSFWPRDSEYMFGCDSVFHSRFCLKCYNSVNLTRCFEVSHSSNSSDCLFCHNIDACAECLFCTNAKALRYAVFNRQYPKEEYLRIKKLVLDEIGLKLEKDKKLDLDIYNIGAPHGHQ